MSRLETPTGTKWGHFILVGGSNRDKRLAQPFVPVGDTNQDKRPPFCPGWCLQPGQKPLHGLTSIDILLFIFTAPLSPSLISFFFPRHLLPVNFLPSHSLPSMRPSPARAGTGEPPHGRGRGPASHRGGAGRRACRTASCRRCRPAGTARTGAEPSSSSRPDRRGLGPAEPPPQRVAKRRGQGLLPPWAGEGKDGDERGLCC